MTYPLEELLRDDQEFNWTEECDISYKKLKRKLVKAPILRFPNWSTKFHVHIDASVLAIGEILTQPRDDGMMSTDPTIIKHQEVHISNSYRNTIRAHCL